MASALDSDDDLTRLRAVHRAASADLADKLIDLALHDDTDVRVEGGMAETYDNIADAAAGALAQILGHQSGVDSRIRTIAFDLGESDGPVANLLYYLGPGAEELRQELATSPEERLRLRAAKAVLSIHRDAAQVAALLADPSPLVRREGMEAGAKLIGHETLLRLMREDPDSRVRALAVRRLRFSPAVGSAPFIAAAAEETDPGVRSALLVNLTYRHPDRPTARAVAGFLDAPLEGDRRVAADGLLKVDDPEITAVIALRVLVEPDDYVLSRLLDHRFLLKHQPRLWQFLDRRHRTCTRDGERHSLAAALRRGTPGPGEERADPLELAASLADRLGLPRPDAVLRWDPGDQTDTEVPAALTALTSDGRWTSLDYRVPVPIAFGVRPERAALGVTCAECGTRHRAEGAIPWSYRDDDHSGHYDDGFTGTLIGTCPSCGTMASARVELTTARSRADHSGDLTWDGR